MNESIYDAAKAYKERIRIDNRELGRLRGLREATEYRIANSHDENEIEGLKNDIEKYDAQILILENDSNECAVELGNIEKPTGA